MRKSKIRIYHNNKGKKCSVQDCENSARSKGYCLSHYNKRRRKIMREKNECPVEC